MSRGLTLDTAPLLALDKNNRQVIALIERAHANGDTITIPASALAQAIGNPATQARLSRLLRQPRTQVVALDRVDATHVGRLLVASGTRDLADAHVVLCAKRTATRVMSSDRGDLEALDPTIQVIDL